MFDHVINNIKRGFKIKLEVWEKLMIDIKNEEKSKFLKDTSINMLPKEQTMLPKRKHNPIYYLAQQ